MVSIAVRVNGLTAVQNMVRQISASGAAWGRIKIRAGTPLVYGYGIETGVRKSGRLARRAGGAFMFRTGITEIKATIKPMLLAAVPQGASAIQSMAQTTALRMRMAIQGGTVVRSGNLRSSIFTQVE